MMMMMTMGWGLYKLVLYNATAIRPVSQFKFNTGMPRVRQIA